MPPVLRVVGASAPNLFLPYSYIAELNMKLTKLQQERIEDIIAQEMRSLKEGWVAAGDLSISSRLKEKRLFEADSPLERDLSGDAMFGALEQAASDEANSCLVAFDDELLKHVAAILKSHGMVDSGTDAGGVYELLADHDEGAMTDAQMECSSDIVNALVKYVATMAQIAIEAVGPGQE